MESTLGDQAKLIRCLIKYGKLMNCLRLPWLNSIERCDWFTILLNETLTCFFSFFCLRRPRVPPVLVRDMLRLTPPAVAAVRSPSTDKRRSVLAAPTLNPRLDLVSVSQCYLIRCNFLFHSFYFAVEWGQKAKRRRTTGTGRMRYVRDLPRRFKNGFREGNNNVY